MDASHEILDAFVDGEAVDPDALKRALSDSAGRDYLVDAWLLRGLVQDEIASEVAIPHTPATGGMRNWLIAATVAGVCLVGGYFVGARYASVIVPRPGPAAAPSEAVTSPPQAFPVPAATRVIRLDMDPNWKESGGGR
ncbi:MAG TPA: hypothetical protein VES67_09895 [Vicinamibacterales bacterium]|nr:hypothetical protein [Vicinamibacterales bacterium]